LSLNSAPVADNQQQISTTFNLYRLRVTIYNTGLRVLPLNLYVNVLK